MALGHVAKKSTSLDVIQIIDVLHYKTDVLIIVFATSPPPIILHSRRKFPDIFTTINPMQVTRTVVSLVIF